MTSSVARGLRSFGVLVLVIVVTGCLQTPASEVAREPRQAVATASAPTQVTASDALQGGESAGGTRSKALSNRTDETETTAEEAAGNERRQQGPSMERIAMELAIRIRVSGCGTLGTGSGFALSDDVVVTNRHVAAGADEVQLSSWDGRSMAASMVTMAVHQDLALLTLDGSSSPVRVASLADHDPAAGNSVFVVGYPGGGEVEVQETKIVDYVDGPRLGVPGNAMRLAAAVQPGNSGGPVLDPDGQVVGVVYGVEKATNYALATPASAVRLLQQRVADEEPSAPSC